MFHFEKFSSELNSNFHPDRKASLPSVINDDAIVSSLFDQLSELTPLRGVSEANFNQLPELIQSLSPWPSHHDPFHTLLVAAEVLMVPIDSVHPARLFLYEQNLTEALQIYESGELQYTNLSPVILEKIQCARECLLRIDRAKLTSFRETVRCNQHSKSELLKALAHPFIVEKITGDFFSWITETQIQSYTVKDGTTSETPAGSYPYLGSDPSFIVRFMCSRFAPTNGHVIDLGCGVGAAILPFALLSDYLLTGIEIDSRWVELARKARKTVDREIELRQQSVLESDLNSGTIFYVYSPFEDIALCRRLVVRLEKEGKERKILVLAPYIPVMHHALLESSELQHIGAIDKNIIPCGYESATAMHIFSSRTH